MSLSASHSGDCVLSYIHAISAHGHALAEKLSLLHTVMSLSLLIVTVCEDQFIS